MIRRRESLVSGRFLGMVNGHMLKSVHEEYKSILSSNIQLLIFTAWHRIKVISGSDSERESNNDEAHLHCKYILYLLSIRD